MIKKNRSTHMMDRPYIKDIIKELQIKGFDDVCAKEVLIKYYRPLKRTLGHGPNARDFARELISLDEAVKRIYDPNDPNQIYVGHLKARISQNIKRRYRS